VLSARLFVNQLLKHNYTAASGVPCSILTPLINSVIDDDRLAYVGASSEGEAIALNAGAHLAGVKTVTLCQNSGLGNMVNPITSINHPFRFPTLLIVTWRGEPGSDDAPQHEFMGKITPALLDKLGIPWRNFPIEEQELQAVLLEVDEWFKKKSLPFALLLSRDQISGADKPKKAPAFNDREGSVELLKKKAAEKTTRTEAIKLVLEQLTGDEVLIGSTGKIGRELYALNDRPRNLYVVGGLGTASAIGCGLSLQRSDLPVVVLDGDASVLMKMGNLATIGAYRPENLVHVLLDNEVHDSTGGQFTVSSRVDLAAVAQACGYRRVFCAAGQAESAEVLREAYDVKGPVLVHLKIKPGSPPALPRPPFSPAENKQRLIEAISV